MNRRKLIKWGAIIAISGLLIGGSTMTYMLNMPHRNIQNNKADYFLTSTDLVEEFLVDMEAANAKYLDAEGESKIVVVSGQVSEISTDMNNQVVVYLKSLGDKAGVSATFTDMTNANAQKLNVGDMTSIKGVIRSGANYDDDLEFYEDVIIEKSDVVQ